MYRREQLGSNARTHTHTHTRARARTHTCARARRHEGGDGRAHQHAHQRQQRTQGGACCRRGGCHAHPWRAGPPVGPPIPQTPGLRWRRRPQVRKPWWGSRANARARWRARRFRRPRRVARVCVCVCVCVLGGGGLTRPCRCGGRQRCAAARAGAVHGGVRPLSAYGGAGSRRQRGGASGRGTEPPAANWRHASGCHVASRALRRKVVTRDSHAHAPTHAPIHTHTATHTHTLTRSRSWPGRTKAACRHTV